MFGGNNPPTGTTSFTTSTTKQGFTFGTPASGSGSGFSFGGAPSQPAASTGGSGGFSFGGGTSTTQPASSAGGFGGFSFGGGTTATQPAAPGLGGTTQTNTQNAQGGFSLPNSAGTSGFSLGGAGQTSVAPGLSLGSTTQSSAQTGFSLGGTSTQPSGSTGFSLGGTTTQSSASTGFSLGGTTSASTGFSLGGTTSASTGFSLGGTTQSSASTGFSLGGSTPSSASTGFSLPGAATTKPAGTQPASAGFSLSSQPTLTLGGGLTKPTQPASSAPGIFGGAVKVGTTNSSTQPSSNLGVTSGFALGGPTSSAAPSLGGIEKPKTATVGFSLPSSTAASSGTTAPQKQMNYQQLEENINKWMQDLEKQEKEFLEQATHVNAWDRLLVENGEKITLLNNDMKRVNEEQKKLDQELDFIKSQQRELDELLRPLEKSVEEQPNISFLQHADLERENTYQLAENIDAKLKRMLQDLKEIIDHLNTSNSNQDNTDPIFQITQILNSHMDSLQWIDQNSALLKRHVEDISKQMEIQRKEQERNFRLVYN